LLVFTLHRLAFHGIHFGAADRPELHVDCPYIAPVVQVMKNADASKVQRPGLRLKYMCLWVVLRKDPIIPLIRCSARQRRSQLIFLSIYPVLHNDVMVTFAQLKGTISSVIRAIEESCTRAARQPGML
jgi:hypothetical protein